jgi:hypothetical protein
MKKLIVLAAVLGLLAGSPALAAAPAESGDSGQFTELAGDVTVTRAGSGAKAALGTKVAQGDVVNTAPNSKGTILFKNGSVLRLGPSTNLTITKLVYDNEKGIANMGYELAMGSIMSVVGSVFSRENSTMEVKTPTAVAGIRGTIFVLDVEPDPRGRRKTTKAIGLEGEFTLTDNTGRSYLIGPNQITNVGDAGFMSPPVEVEHAELDGVMNKVTIAPDQPKMDPISSQNKSADFNGDVLKNPDFTAPGPDGGGASGSPGGGVSGPSGGAVSGMSSGPSGGGDVQKGDNPAELIYQEPPPFTILHFALIFGP